jgi:hypothetical protein
MLEWNSGWRRVGSWVVFVPSIYVFGEHVQPTRQQSWGRTSVQRFVAIVFAFQGRFARIRDLGVVGWQMSKPQI